MSAIPPSIDTTRLGDTEPSGLRRVDKIVEQVALFMVPTGFIFIILGWNGASRTVLTFEQIPYLISGGLLGLGLMIGGGLLYVGGWIARTAQLIPTETPTAAMTSMLATMSSAGGNGNGAPHATYLRTPSGMMFHRADCAVVSGRADAVAVKDGEVASYKACGMCDPLAVV